MVESKEERWLEEIPGSGSPSNLSPAMDSNSLVRCFSICAFVTLEIAI
jgi:hypothetical protein